MKTSLLFLALSLSATSAWAELKQDSTVVFNADGSYHEKTLFSHNTEEGEVIAFGYAFEDGTWVPYSKTEHIFSSDKNFYNNYFWNDSDWSIVNQTHLYSNGESHLSYYSTITGFLSLQLENTYDEQENKWVQKVLTYDSTTGEKLAESITENWYDANGNQTGFRFVDNNINYPSPGLNSYWRKTTDSQGNPLEEIHYIWLDKEQGWEESTRQVWTYDSNSNKTSKAHYSWDKSKKSWTARDKWERTYDNRSNLTSETKYYYDEYNTHELLGTIKYEYTYDDNNYQTSEISYSWMYGQWVSTYKKERAWDARGNILNDTHYRFEYGDWKISEGPVTYDYTYDKNGNATLGYASYEGKVFEMIEFAYDSRNNRTKKAYYYKDEKTGLWQKSDKTEWEYNAKGQKIEERSYNGERTNEWVYIDKETYEYDNEGRLAKETYYNWVDKLIMIPYLEKEYEYYDSGEKERETSIRYDRGVAIEIHVCEYNRDEEILSSESSYYESGRWKGDYIFRRVEEADAYNRPLLRSNYVWMNGEWICTQSDIYEYDSFGHETLSQHNSYTPETGASTEDKTENFYDSKGRLTGTLHTMSTNGTITQGQKSTVTYDFEYQGSTPIKELKTSTYFNWDTNDWVMDHYTYEYLSDSATGIEEIKSEAKASTPAKVFRNGRFYIIGSDGTYNLGGIRM